MYPIRIMERSLKSLCLQLKSGVKNEPRNLAGDNARGKVRLPTMREARKVVLPTRVVPDSTSHDNEYKTPTDMIHVNPRVAQTNGPIETQAQRRNVRN
ncbi:hypothetical protein ACSQ67_023554 [Phaseolus vulgaris]